MGDKLDISKVGVPGSFGSKYIEDPVATVQDLPTNVDLGSICWVLSENKWYEREANGTWSPQAGGTGGSGPSLGTFTDEFVCDTEGKTTWTLTYTPVNLDSVTAYVGQFIQDKSNLVSLNAKTLTTVPTKAGTKLKFVYVRAD